MPNAPKTKARGIRVPDELWQAALEKAKAEDTTVTAVVLKELRRYVR